MDCRGSCFSGLEMLFRSHVIWFGTLVLKHKEFKACESMTTTSVLTGVGALEKHSDPVMVARLREHARSLVKHCPAMGGQVCVPLYRWH